MTRLIGVVHVPALPGAPRNRLTLTECMQAAVIDAQALRDGGADALIVENFHDYPFRAEGVEPHVVAALTAICLEIRERVDIDLGVNVLRNDARSALGIAAACGGSFVRINVHTGAMVTDQGIITGQAHDTMRLRRALGAEHIRVYADVLVKHAVPLGPQRLTDAAQDAVDRGLADAIIVTGTATGAEATPVDVAEAAAAVDVPTYVGSGVSADNVAAYLPHAAGFIVGSWLKRGGVVAEPVDAERVRRLRETIDRER